MLSLSPAKNKNKYKKIRLSCHFTCHFGRTQVIQLLKNPKLEGPEPEKNVSFRTRPKSFAEMCTLSNMVVTELVNHDSNPLLFVEKMSKVAKLLKRVHCFRVKTSRELRKKNNKKQRISTYDQITNA